EKNVLEKVTTDLADVARLFAESPEFHALMVSPRAPNEWRQAMLDKLFGKELGLVRNFLGVIAMKGRGAELPNISEAFHELREEQMGHIRCEITLAGAPDEPLLEGVRDVVSGAVGREARIEFKSDPGIIGGAIIKVRDTVLDASVRGHLRRLEKNMKNPA